MKFLTAAAILTICGLAAAGHLHHGTSYSVVTKHEPSKHYSWSGHDNSHTGWAGAQSESHGWEQHDFHAHPKYEFKYGVKDLKNGDIKDQWEHRDGDHVKGSYTLKEADGTTRVVDYHADAHTGFHADVKKIGHAYHPEVHHHYQHHGGWDGGYVSDHGHGHATSYAGVHLY